ncbi:hypothetical protein D9M71_378840 [compost metagenome]
MQAEGVFAGQVLGAGRPFTQQRRERETFASGDLENRFGATVYRMRTLAHDPALLDDIEVLDRAVGGFDDALAGSVKTQLTLLDQIRQVRVFHLVERREALKELQCALDVLQHRGFPCLCEGVRFTHNHYRSLF